MNKKEKAAKKQAIAKEISSEKCRLKDYEIEKLLDLVTAIR